MERLTKKYAGGYGLVNVKDNEQSVESSHPNALREILKSVKTLGAYEDTGLTPEEINHLLQANRTVAKERDAYGKGIESLQAQLFESNHRENAAIHLIDCLSYNLISMSENTIFTNPDTPAWHLVDIMLQSINDWRGSNSDNDNSAK